ncbi:hypothetical protein, partial [Nocardia sp. JMUB6875]|uniref:hypothetical protein n=1 Tax=Nocardia sp. JMUB6875 TaxID=3158170 RepID=UPI0034E8E97F
RVGVMGGQHGEVASRVPLRWSSFLIVLLATILAVSGQTAPAASESAGEKGGVTIREKSGSNFTAYRGVVPALVEKVSGQTVVAADFPPARECEGIAKRDLICDGFEVTADPAEAAATQSIGPVTLKDGTTAHLAGGVARVVLRKHLTLVRVSFDVGDRDEAIAELRQHYDLREGESLMDGLGRQDIVLMETVRYPAPDEAEDFDENLTSGEITRILIPYNWLPANGDFRGIGKISMDRVLSGYQAYQTGVRTDWKDPRQVREVLGQSLGEVQATCATGNKDPKCAAAQLNWSADGATAKNAIDKFLAKKDILGEMTGKVKTVSKNTATATLGGVSAKANKVLNSKVFKGVAGGAQAASALLSIGMLATNWNEVAPAEMIETVMSVMPVTSLQASGQLLGIIEAAKDINAKGAVEKVVVNTVSLAMIAIAPLCGPCAAVGGAAVALYNLVSGLIAQQMAAAAERKRADALDKYIKDFKDKGAVIDWEKPEFDGIISHYPDTMHRTQTIKLSSQGIPYTTPTFNPIRIDWPYGIWRTWIAIEEYSVWQNGKRVQRVECDYYACLADPLHVELDHPAWIDITYNNGYHSQNPCDRAKSETPYPERRELKSKSEPDFCAIPTILRVEAIGQAPKEAGNVEVTFPFELPFTQEFVPGQTPKIAPVP